MGARAWDGRKGEGDPPPLWLPPGRDLGRGKRSPEKEIYWNENWKAYLERVIGKTTGKYLPSTPMPSKEGRRILSSLIVFKGFRAYENIDFVKFQKFDYFIPK